MNAISDQVLVQGAAIIVAIISLIGTVISSWFSLKEKQKAKTSEAERRAQEEAAQQKKEAEQAKKALEDERRVHEMKELRKELQKLKEEQDAMSKRSAQRIIRVDRRHNKINQRIGDNEQGITKITQILVKNARSYSGLMRFNDQLTTKLQQIIQMERHNLSLTRGVADILEDLAIVVKDCTELSQGDFSKELAALAVIIKQASDAKSKFLNSMMDATFETVMSDNEKKAWHDSGHDSLNDISAELDGLTIFRPNQSTLEEESILDDDEEDEDLKSLQKQVTAHQDDVDDDDEEEPEEVPPMDST